MTTACNLTYSPSMDPSHVEPVAPSGPEPKSTAAPRKRRRRTTTTGATEDCFTCRKRQAQCDRRRPYCSQCLETGKDCSGYKTTLTWGVGIASRGKLRGLTCPVAEKAEQSASVSKKASISQRRKSSISNRLAESSVNTRTDSVPPPAKVNSDIEPHGLLSPQPQAFWQSVHQYAAFLVHPTSPQFENGAPNFPLTPSSLSYATDGLSPSTNYRHLSATNPCPDNVLFLDPPQNEPISVNEESFEELQESAYFEPLRDQESTDYDQFMQPDNVGYNDLSLDLTDSQQTIHSMQQSLTLSIPQSIVPSKFYHLAPRMQYLLDYYDKNICSVLVAFDDPTNPYRMHILQHAMQNEGLQNALAALSLNNMRMRLHKRNNVKGIVKELPEDQHSRPSPEESYYKSISIGRLQAQLADVASAQDDSVLAILLILCLFHVCDSGFSKFKTQLEGVQKLLRMRDPGVRTGFIGWVEMFFAWFDVMTSTVNDRETEIQGNRLDMLHYSSNLGAMEQFSGCDGRLFKLIARLGRLNLLSQNRPVRPDPTESMQSKDKTLCTPRRWQTRAQFDPMDFGRLDGNGWGALTTSPPREEESNPEDPIDSRQEFWSEWHDIRSRLELWSMEAPCLSPTSLDLSDSTLAPGQRDLLHINESFRSSALLYTERLAHPFLPSSSPKFQTHVHTALSHITALEVTSCVNKFLLWPLFIAGTECVDPADQALIRDRCVEIQIESGFFNNISVLDVLERVWAENDGRDAEEVQRRRDSAKENGDRVQAFRWRKAMDRVDGEYLVV